MVRLRWIISNVNKRDLRRMGLLLKINLRQPRDDFDSKMG